MQRLTVTPPKSVESEGTLIRFIGKELIWFRGGSSALGKKGFDTVLSVVGPSNGNQTISVECMLHFDKENMIADQNWLKLIDAGGKLLPSPLKFNGSTRRMDVRIQINTISKLHNNAAFFVEFMVEGGEHVNVRTDPIVIKTKACSNGPNCSIQVSLVYIMPRTKSVSVVSIDSCSSVCFSLSLGPIACSRTASNGIQTEAPSRR
jgi:hypothetical protein